MMTPVTSISATNLATLQRIVRDQFDLEILLKRAELRTIDDHFLQCEELMTQLEHFLLSKSLSSLSSSAATSIAQRLRSRDPSGSLPFSSLRNAYSLPTSMDANGQLFDMLENGTFIRWYCPICQRNQWASTQGLRNHIRFAHRIAFVTREEFMRRCAQVVDENEVPVYHPCRSNPIEPLLASFEGPATSEELSSIRRDASETMDRWKDLALTDSANNTNNDGPLSPMDTDERGVSGRVQRPPQEEEDDDPREGSRFYVHKRIVVGNSSQFIPPEKRDSSATHRWMVYAKGSEEEEDVSHFVSKVRFFLHPSFRPNDIVDVTEPPFCIKRRGWGEFPVRVQLHFKDAKHNKPVDIIHMLRLENSPLSLSMNGYQKSYDVEIDRMTYAPPPLLSLPLAAAGASSPAASTDMANPSDTEAATPLPFAKQQQQLNSRPRRSSLSAPGMTGRTPSDWRSSISSISPRAETALDTGTSRLTSTVPPLPEIGATMEQWLAYAIAFFPVILAEGQNPSQGRSSGNSNNLKYTPVGSLKEYLHLTPPRQKALEWGRARRLCDYVQSKMGADASELSSKFVVQWCRENGHTPTAMHSRSPSASAATQRDRKPAASAVAAKASTPTNGTVAAVAASHVITPTKSAEDEETLESAFSFCKYCGSTHPVKFCGRRPKKRKLYTGTSCTEMPALKHVLHHHPFDPSASVVPAIPMRLPPSQPHPVPPRPASSMTALLETLDLPVPDATQLALEHNAVELVLFKSFLCFARSLFERTVDAVRKEQNRVYTREDGPAPMTPVPADDSQLNRAIVPLHVFKAITTYDVFDFLTNKYLTPQQPSLQQQLQLQQQVPGPSGLYIPSTPTPTGTGTAAGIHVAHPPPPLA